jgi:hypothetical protein
VPLPRSSFLAPAPPPGAFDHVVRRGRGLRRRKQALVASGLALVLASGALVGVLRLEQDPDALQPVQPSPTSEVAYVGGSTLVDPETGDRIPVVRPGSTASRGPLAVWSADHRTVLYNSSPESPPDIGKIGDTALRRIDRTTGSDTVVSAGVDSWAWRGEGPIAYARFAGTDDRGVSLETVVVQATPTSEPVPWISDPDRYEVVAWTGATLLVLKGIDEREAGGTLLALDGPGRVRTVASDIADLIALSPDGRTAFVSTFVPDDDSTLGHALLDVATGAVVGRVDLGDLTDRSFSGPGQWDGDEVVAGAGDTVGVFRVDAGGLRLTETIDVTEVAPWFQDPVFSHDHTHLIGTTTDSPPNQLEGAHHALIDCDRRTHACRLTVVDLAVGQQFGIVRNPSRP